MVRAVRVIGVKDLGGFLRSAVLLFGPHDAVYV